MSRIRPTPDQISTFIQGDMNAPVGMLNLLKFKPLATYEDGAEEASQNLTGAQAYALYGAGVAKVLEKIGAKVVYSGPVQQFMIGEGDWDAAAIVVYPTRQAFIDMPQREDYQAIHYHRDAGLSHQDLIATHPLVS